jgi:hypothetical protein
VIDVSSAEELAARPFNGDIEGGNADLAEAKAIKPDIVEDVGSGSDHGLQTLKIARIDAAGE